MEFIRFFAERALNPSGLHPPTSCPMSTGDGSPELAEWFANGEMRSVRVSFES